MSDGVILVQYPITQSKITPSRNEPNLRRPFLERGEAAVLFPGAALPMQLLTTTVRRSFSAVILLAAVLLTGCAARERKTEQPDPSYDPTVSATDSAKTKPEDVATLIGLVTQPETAAEDAIQTKDKKKKEEVRFSIREDQLRQRFIHEFGDGTVVDKALITPIRDEPRDKPTYYLVGMGQLNGEYRAMALQLYATKEGSLFLKPDADRFIASGTNCPMCYFRYSRGKITGVDCADESTGRTARRCDLKRETGNRLYPQALKAEPMGQGQK